MKPLHLHPLPILFTLALSTPHIPKRSTCTVTSRDDPFLDDTPGITAALQECGSTGRILLPINQTFHLRSPLDLSACKACDFQLNGVLSLSPDWDYWEKQSAAIKIPHTRAAIVRSDGDTGVIDARRFGWASDGAAPGSERIPKLFSISDGSDHVLISNLKIRNVAGTAFHVGTNSSAIQFNNIEFETPATTAYEFEQAQHVYIWNNTIRANASCVSIIGNASNIQVQESTCIARSHAGSPAPNGIQLTFREVTQTSFVKNIFVKALKAIGDMNVIALLAMTTRPEEQEQEDYTPHSLLQPPTLEIQNATFADISIEGPAKRAVLLQQDDSILKAMDIVFRDVKGEAVEESALVCVHQEDECVFRTGEWVGR